MAIFILTVFAIWRISLFFFAWLGSKIAPFSPRFPYWDVFLIPSGLPSWIWSFANFDGVHYLTIASRGYSAQFTQVFFPAFPLLIAVTEKIIPLQPIIIGILLSNIFMLGSLFVFVKLLQLDYKNNNIKWTLSFLILFPTSFFFGNLYTESLFFLLLLLSFYFARKGKFWISGICAGLAAATRVTGILLLPALLWEHYHSSIKYQVSGMKYKTKLKRLILNTYHLIRSPVSLLVPLGLIIYMLYLQINFGDWLYFWHVQPVFGAARSGSHLILLPQVFFRYIKMIFSVNIHSESFWIAMLELISVIFALILLTIGRLKRIRTSYLIYSWLSLILPTLTGTFSSMPRYILTLFPLFIVLGLIGNSLIKVFILLVFSLLLSILTILFTRGHWVA